MSIVHAQRKVEGKLFGGEHLVWGFNDVQPKHKFLFTFMSSITDDYFHQCLLVFKNLIYSYWCNRK